MNKREHIQLPSAPIQKNMDLLAQRELVGLDKYGVTLGDANLSHAALLQHGLEEALDLANYLQASLIALNQQVDYKAEHAILMDLLNRYRHQAYEGTYATKLPAPDPTFAKLLDGYVIDAAKRGIRT